MSDGNLNMGPGPMGPRSEGPSRVFYLLALIVLAAGVAFFALFLIKSIKEMRDGLTQVVVPGSAEVEMAKPGTYTVFHEYRSVVGGKVYGSPPSISGLEVTVMNKDDGSELALGPVNGSMTYNVGSRSGVGLYQFTVTKPGTYVVTGEYEDPHSTGETVLAIGQGYLEKLLVTIFAAIGIMFASVAASVVIFVVTLVKRRKALALAR